MLGNEPRSDNPLMSDVIASEVYHDVSSLEDKLFSIQCQFEDGDIDEETADDMKFGIEMQIMEVETYA
jgi:hypothetical protein